MTTLAIRLPDELAEQARKEGLLAPQTIQGILRKELLIRKTQPFFALMDKLHAAKLPPMSMEEIQAEVEAARTSLRRAAARRPCPPHRTRRRDERANRP
jgi:hypothetical protein